jgi:pimeloyl-ACP methyl ester carboxylesterase
MPFLSVASPRSMMHGAQVYFEDRTVEQARTILFLHDWPFNRQEWAYPVALFSRGYRTITIDLPGFGRSDQPGGLISYESLARDVGAVAKVLNLANVIVVGAGMGAAVGMTLYRCFPRLVAGLVLVGAIAPRWVRTTDFSAGVPRRDVEDFLEKSETRWPDLVEELVQSRFHTEVGDATRTWFASMALESSLYAVQQSLLAMRDADLRDELAGIEVPTVVFHGAHDAIAPPALGAYLARHIPRAKLIRFEHSGHALWIDEGFRFNTELTGFIEKTVYGNVLPPPGTQKLPGGGERLPFEEIATRPRRGPAKVEGAAGEEYE